MSVSWHPDTCVSVPWFVVCGITTHPVLVHFHCSMWRVYRLSCTSVLSVSRIMRPDPDGGGKQHCLANRLLVVAKRLQVNRRPRVRPGLKNISINLKWRIVLGLKMATAYHLSA